MEDHRLEKSLRLAIILTSMFFVIEVIGGYVSGSLSLLGDAGHMFRDVLALFISLSAMQIARRLPTKTRTFGYHRIEILAAFLNGIALIAISAFLLREGYLRLLSPRPVESGVMFAVAIVGLAVNVYVATRLRESRDINVRSAFMHVVMDALISVGVVAASVWIFFTGHTVVDPALGMGISIVVFVSAFTILKDAARILLEFAPKDVGFDDVIKDLEGVDGVKGAHNVHLWSICSNINAVDAHVFTDRKDLVKIEEIKQEIRKRLEKYNIKHVTLEFECEECVEKEKVRKVGH